MQAQDSIKVSVIMPVYNAYSYLRDAIEGVLSQSLSELELICVDDGSTDRSLDILREYMQRDSRVRVLTQNNAGPSWARNKGLSRARGEYIIFLDADDLYEPELLKTLYELAERDNLDIAITDFDIYNMKRSSYERKIPADRADIFEPGKVISKADYPDDILQCTENYVWNKLFRASFIKSRELAFNQDLRVFEDVYFVVGAVALADRIGKNFDILVHHRVYPGQSKTKLFRKYYMQVPDIYLGIKTLLMQHGVYLPLLKSYLTLSASKCYKVYNVLWWGAKAEMWEKLHEGGYAERLGWEALLRDEIDDEEAQVFASSALVNTHKKEIRRFRRDLTLKPGRARKKLRRLRFARWCLEILKWMFGKPSKYSRHSRRAA